MQQSRRRDKRPADVHQLRLPRCTPVAVARPKSTAVVNLGKEGSTPCLPTDRRVVPAIMEIQSRHSHSITIDLTSEERMKFESPLSDPRASTTTRGSDLSAGLHRQQKPQRHSPSKLPAPNTVTPRLMTGRRYKRTAKNIDQLPEVPLFTGRKRRPSSEFESSSPKRPYFGIEPQTRSSGNLFSTPAHLVHAPDSSPPEVVQPSRLSSLENLSPVSDLRSVLRRAMDNPPEPEQVGDQSESVGVRQAPGEQFTTPNIPAQGRTTRHSVAQSRTGHQSGEGREQNETHQHPRPHVETDVGVEPNPIVEPPTGRYLKADWERDAVLILLFINRIHEPLVGASVGRLINQEHVLMARGAMQLCSTNRRSRLEDELRPLLPDGAEYWKIADENRFLDILRKFIEGWDRSAQDTAPTETAQPLAADNVGLGNPASQGPGIPFTFQAPQPTIGNPLPTAGIRDNARNRKADQRADRAEHRLEELRVKAANTIRQNQETSARAIAEQREMFEARILQLERRKPRKRRSDSTAPLK